SEMGGVAEVFRGLVARASGVQMERHPGIRGGARRDPHVRDRTSGKRSPDCTKLHRLPQDAYSEGPQSVRRERGSVAFPERRDR
ncbi:MAG: hypothetical protein PHN89_05085, partial [Candidatus Pacebacteria bacterium]|nr:hypothetical protein [Candidatus Paceibacterota bacterium]